MRCWRADTVDGSLVWGVGGNACGAWVWCVSGRWVLAVAVVGDVPQTRLVWPEFSSKTKSRARRVSTTAWRSLVGTRMKSESG